MQPPTSTAESSRERRARRRALHHRINRGRHRTGHPGRRAWRELPATREQLAALRLIATATGRTFTAGVTRGEAWRRIKQATSLLDEPARRRCAPPWHSSPREP